MLSKYILGASVIAIALSSSTAAFSQTAEPATQVAQSAGDSDIVVTASRREQSLSKVPISVAAFSAEAMDRETIRGIEDIVRNTPGVTLTRTFGNSTRISIRGIDGSGAGTTGIYIDDTPIQVRSLNVAAYNVYPLVFDLERVEVLRGPQGTLFGSGSQGGTVRFITPEPQFSGDSMYGRAEVSTIQGGSVGYEAGLAYGTALVEDKIGIRLSAWTRRGGGYIDKLDPVTKEVKDRNINKSEAQVFRAAVAFKPTERLTITPSFYYQNQRQGDVGWYWIQGFSNPDDNQYATGITTDQPATDRFMLSTLKVNYEGDGFTVTSNTSRFVRSENSVYDYSTLIPAYYMGANFAPAFPNYPAYAEFWQKQKVSTQEVRVQSDNPSSPFTWLIGGFFQNATQTVLEDIVDRNYPELIDFYHQRTVEEYSGQSMLTQNRIFFETDHVVDRQWAAFGELSYTLFDQLTFTGGFRYAKMKTTLNSFATGPFNAGTTEVSGSVSEKPFTPKFAVSWQASDATLIYANAAKGFRAGGVNRSIPYDPSSTVASVITCTDDQDRNGGPVPRSYTSDQLWSYEVGTKTSMFDRRLTVDASAFLIKWKDIQVSRGACGIAALNNSGDAESKGFELALGIRPVNALNIGVAVSYVDAAYSKAQTSIGASGAVSTVVAKGDALVTQPWTVTANVQYDATIADRDAYLRADYEFRGGFSASSGLNPITSGYNNQNIRPDSYHFVTLRAGMKFGPVDLSAFVKNLTNDNPQLYYRQERRNVNDMFKGGTIDPRTFGLTAILRY